MELRQTADNRAFQIGDLELPAFIRINKELDANHVDEHARLGYSLTNIFPSKRWEYPWALQVESNGPEDVVLDAGCGTSPLATYLGRRGTRVVALEAQLRWARVQDAAARLHEIPLRALQASICRLPFGDCVFNRVYCISVLEHLSPSEQLDAVRELARVLRPGGLLVITVDYDQREYLNEYQWDGEVHADTIFDWRAICSRIIEPSGLQVHGSTDFSVDDWDSHRQCMSLYHHRQYTSFGLALRRPIVRASEPLRRSPDVKFEVGINLPYLGDRYGNDLGPNIHHPTWGFGYEATSAARTLNEIATLGFTSVRFWLFESGEGLEVDARGLVTGVTATFIENFLSFQKLVASHGLRAYWCLLDANAFVYSAEPILYAMLQHAEHQDAFVTNALRPWLALVDGETCFGVDLMNEPEACVQDRWGKAGVSWPALHRFLARTRRSISELRPDLSVSCGSGWVDTLSITDGRYEGLDLDWLDFHHYRSVESLPRREAIAPHRRVLLGELQTPDNQRQWSVGQIVAELRQARLAGYAGTFLWSYHELLPSIGGPDGPLFSQDLNQALHMLRREND